MKGDIRIAFCLQLRRNNPWRWNTPTIMKGFSTGAQIVTYRILVVLIKAISITCPKTSSYYDQGLEINVVISGFCIIQGVPGLSGNHREPKKEELKAELWLRVSGVEELRRCAFGVPIISIVVPFWGYLFGSLISIWLNQKKERQWRP